MDGIEDPFVVVEGVSTGRNQPVELAHQAHADEQDLLQAQFRPGDFAEEGRRSGHGEDTASPHACVERKADAHDPLPKRSPWSGSGGGFGAAGSVSHVPHVQSAGSPYSAKPQLIQGGSGGPNASVRPSGGRHGPQYQRSPPRPKRGHAAPHTWHVRTVGQ